MGRDKALSLLSHISFVAAILYRLKSRDTNPWEFAIALFAYAILFAFYPQSLLNDDKKTIALLLFMALLIVIV